MAKKPTAAKDLKAGDARVDYLKKGKKNAAKTPKVISLDDKTTGRSLTVVKKQPGGRVNKANPPDVIRLSDKSMKGRELVPVKQEPRVRGNANKANPPKVINLGGGSKTSKLAGVARTVGRVAGPIGAAVGFIADASPAGAGSDKPKGPLMQGTRMRSRPEKPGSYPAAKPKASGARPETPGAYPAAKATPVPKPKAKPASEAPKAFKKGSSSPPAYTPEKAQKRGNVTSGFSGNWVGAAPTEMQKRGGARIDKGGGLLGKLRSK